MQNGYDPNYDAPGAFNYPPAIAVNYPPANVVNTQVDSAGIDVRLTQLRNLLAGTRPPQKTTLGTGIDGDTNLVSVETASGSGVGSPLVMPNGVADPHDTAFRNRRERLPGGPARNAAGRRPVGRGRLDTGRSL